MHAGIFITPLWRFAPAVGFSLRAIFFGYFYDVLHVWLEVHQTAWHTTVLENKHVTAVCYSPAAFLSYGNINTFTSRIETAIGWSVFFFFCCGETQYCCRRALLIRRRNMLPFLLILVTVLARSDLLCVEWVTDHQSCAGFISVDGSTNRNALKYRWLHWRKPYANS